MSSTPASTPVWFITGCSTGFGRELALAVLDKGWRAVVTARQPGSLTEFSERYGERALVLELDVTRREQIDHAVQHTLQQFGRLDVLVNNAGYGYLSAIEEGDDQDVRDMFEVNFFGLADTIKAVLPVMRKQRAGHIVNITSVGGLIGNPGSGYYGASKFAVEGLSEALGAETAELGIKVIAVEPGPFRTDWAGRSLKQTKTPIDAYDTIAGQRRAAISAHSGKQPGDPARAALAIIAAVESPTPPAHLILGSNGLERVKAKLDALRAEIAAWEAVTRSADFPD
ncbi:oxidoreductase [Burkholderia plantarii]|uniref:Putative oxidoreductase n=1 Tax=Burkholderia plantarii TaxID=41899 RepID=A0A0B6SAB9_BURPL|nr:oxidoreductase [Burkholderia plantarii]AJK49211.1 putative oxidoreductase [Burkholderia plantarii]ALK33458.1 short chain dehydrogenase [Burkholderia plantarii]WLE62517.1 oxidoreductase [Burkholderia plantarii]GLZ16630.1 short-chain dehydrogenase/reductase [Burkholderia plantarii]